MSGSGTSGTTLSHHSIQQWDTSDNAESPLQTSVGFPKPQGAISGRSNGIPDMKQSHPSEQQWDTTNDTEAPEQVTFVPLK